MSYQFGGIALPWSNSLSSYFDQKNDHDVLSTSIVMIIFTALGERVMLPTFGSRIHETVFEPGDPQLSNFIQSIIVNAIQEWDYRIEVLDVQLSLDDTNDSIIEQNQVSAKVVYRNKFTPLATQTVQFSFTGDGVIPGF